MEKKKSEEWASRQTRKSKKDKTERVTGAGRKEEEEEEKRWERRGGQEVWEQSCRVGRGQGRGGILRVS